VIKLDREQAISVGALAAVLLLGAIALEWSFHVRANAVQEFGERNELLSRLQARVKSRRDAHELSGTAPAAAFLDAATQGLAGAQLQAHLNQVAADHHAVLISSGVEPPKREDPPDSIRLQATLEVNLQALQTLLYQLESGTPYVFVDALTVQPASAAAGHAADDPLLRATMSLRAFWREAR
jgi:general secretion pathway protein M